MKLKIYNIATLLSVSLGCLGLVGCGSNNVAIDYTAPEENSLNIQKITDENSNTVLGPAYFGLSRLVNFATSTYGGSKTSKFYWSTSRLLDMSPDGIEIAYLNRNNKQDNIMIRRAATMGAATQRTFRNVIDFSWGKDNNLYFSDYTDDSNWPIGAINAHSGSIIRQLTSNNNDKNPVISKDGKLMLFTRVDRTGASIWSLNLEDNTLTTCSRGFSPCFIGDSNEEYLCVRNSTSGNSEIWRVNYVKGQEILLLSDKNKGFTNPVVSPDGQWILCQGNAKSSAKKTENLDIFAVRIDGSQLTQITYHPANDCCPVWSQDGKYIYFLSTRGSKDASYNVWRMRFAL